MIDTCRACGGLYDDMGHCEDCESYYNVCDQDDQDETPEEVIVVCDLCGWSAKVLSDYSPHTGRWKVGNKMHRGGAMAFHKWYQGRLQ